MPSESVEQNPQSASELQLKWRPFAQLKQQVQAPQERIFCGDDKGLLVIQAPGSTGAGRQ